MLQDWISNKVSQIRQRFDHMEMSDRSTSSGSSTGSSSSGRSNGNRSRSHSHSNNRRLYPMTPENIERVCKLIKQKMAVADTQNYLNPDDRRALPCQECFKRVAKFIGEKCEKHGPICRYCAYKLILEAFSKYNSNNSLLVGKCTLCYGDVSGITRLSRRWRMQHANNNNENVPTPESSRGEISVSFQDYAQMWLRENRRGGRVNRAFESSGSF